MSDDHHPNLAAGWSVSALSEFMGIKTIAVEADRVEAQMLVTENLLNRHGNLHGGAIMALADNTGGSAAFIGLRAGESTTTTESKTNFFVAIVLGETVRAVATPLHRGRSLQVWQTDIYKEDGRLAAQVTQSQFTLKPVQK